VGKFEGDRDGGDVGEIEGFFVGEKLGLRVLEVGNVVGSSVGI